MKGQYRIELSQGDLHYDLTIQDKYSLIVGNSGTGKTTICTLLDNNYVEYLNDEENFNPSINLKINGEIWANSNVKIYNLPATVEYSKFLEDKKNSIIFIDEFHPLLKKSSIGVKLNRYNNYFVIICRKNLNSLSVDVDSVFELKAINKNNQIINKLEPWVQFNYDNEIYVDALVTEDEKSGYNYFSKIVKNNCLSTLRGRGNLLKVLKEVLDNSKNLEDSFYVSKSDIAFLIDGCGYGSELYRLYNYLLSESKIAQTTDKLVYILLIKSFEVMLLRSDVFNKYGISLQTIEQELVNIDFNQIHNKEKYYESILNKYF
jgi:hypothetical protein